MRTLLIGFALFTVACSPTNAEPDGGATVDAGPCFPVLHVCVISEGSGPAVDATVTATRPGDAPAVGHTGADGCVELDVPQGSWSLVADTASLCRSEMVMVDVPACGTVEQSLTALVMLCVDGTL